MSEQEFRLANGERMTRSTRYRTVPNAERVSGADVIFGEDGDRSLLGATTLESLGLALDPLKRELRPIPMVL